MITLKLNNIQCDLNGDEEIACTYSIAPISDISKRDSAKSITFELPRTANNLRAIENNHVVLNDSTLPYSLIPCELLVNGLDMNINFAELVSVKDTISLRVYGANVDFFSLIKNKKLSDLDLSAYEIDWTLANVAASATNTQGLVFALIDYHSDSPNTFIDIVDRSIDVRALLPSVYLHTVISTIISEAGYTVNGDFISNVDYLNCIIPLTGTKNPNSKLKIIKTDAQALGYVTSLGIRYDVINFDETTVSDSYNIFETRTVDYEENAFSPIVPNGTTFEVLADGDYQFKLYFNYYTNKATINNNFFKVVRRRAGVNTDVSTGADIVFVAGTYVLTYDTAAIALERGDILFIVVDCQGNDVILLAGTYMECIAQPENFVFGEYVNISPNIPNIKQSDLMKAIAQKFNLIYQVDAVNKILYVRQFSDIIANIPNALDWSDKIDYSEKTEIKFNSDYSQLNNLVYSDDETVNKPVGTDYVFEIDNDNLDAEKDLFKSPFAASEQVLRFIDKSIAQIKIFTNFNTANEEIADVEPRILYKRMELFSTFTYTDGTNNTNVSNVPLTHFILDGQDFNLGWQNNLKDYSSDLFETLQSFKVITELMRLKASDINQLDFFVPIWLSKHNAYFYISQIKQFKFGRAESTEVELVKLS